MVEAVAERLQPTPNDGATRKPRPIPTRMTPAPRERPLLEHRVAHGVVLEVLPGGEALPLTSCMPKRWSTYSPKVQVNQPASDGEQQGERRTSSVLRGDGEGGARARSGRGRRCGRHGGGEGGGSAPQDRSRSVGGADGQAGRRRTAPGRCGRGGRASSIPLRAAASTMARSMGSAGGRGRRCAAACLKAVRAWSSRRVADGSTRPTSSSRDDRRAGLGHEQLEEAGLLGERCRRWRPRTGRSRPGGPGRRRARRSRRRHRGVEPGPNSR